MLNGGTANRSVVASFIVAQYFGFDGFYLAMNIATQSIALPLLYETRNNYAAFSIN